MKEEKLFEIVNNIDDELICEMLEYGADTEKKGEEYEGKLYSGPQKQRKIHYWKYPVTAAALMLVLAGVLFIFNRGSTLPYNEEGTTDSEQGPDETTDNAQGIVTTTEDPGTPVDTNIPYDFTEEDKELQRFLEKTANEALKYQGLYDSGYFGDIGWQIEGDEEHDGVIYARFPQLEQDVVIKEYVFLSDELSFKTADELEEELSLYYSSEIVSEFMGYVGIGEITERTEDACLIEIKNAVLDDNGFMYGVPRFIEINGRLYRDTGAKGGWFTPNWSMAKVISKTDEELIFSFLGYGMDDIKQIRAGLGRLKNEDGWKYDWWDICTPYEMVDPEEVWGIKTVQSAALDLLHCRIDEEGRYRVDDGEVTESDDYDLFRKYFFGTWDGAFSYYFLADTYGIVIDDSLNSFNMQSPEPWYTGNFYRIGDSTLSFLTGSMAGGTVFWLDMNDPETMYSAGGGFGEHNWIWSEEEGEMPVVYVLKKTDLPPNEPEDNFMSIFKLREISRDYGIDFDLLTDLGFEYYGEDGGRYWLSHNWQMCFYPVYLVSQSPDKFEFTATVTGGYDDVEAEAYYTIEKINGEWVRTAEGYRNVKDNIMQSRALTLLRCWPDEEGLYRVDQNVVTVIEDFDLFRQYFFGTWEGSSESEKMVIDDSLKSFNMTDDDVWYSGPFYKIGDNTYAFIKGGGEPMVYWLNTLDTETMYCAYGDVKYWLKSTNEDETAPVVYSLKKTSALPNMPEENFLSIFRLYEIARDYGIDYNLLVNIEFGYDGEGVGYLLTHNDFNRFYPVYLVSESADRLEFETTIGIGDSRDNDIPIEVSCIFEKSDGKWTRTVSASSLNWEVTLIGDYDRGSLVDFDYSEALAKIAARDDIDTGNFLDDGYSEFKELYRKAYALNTIMLFPDSFPNTADIGSPTFKWDDLPQIQVTDESYPIGYRTYYLTGYNFVDFYNKMTEVFSTEQADELIFGNKLFYNYEGALWCSNAATGGDMTRVYTEYEVEKTDDILDIIRTTYHVPLGETPEFDPEKIDEYETKITHFKFARYGGTWLAFEFADVR